MAKKLKNFLIHVLGTRCMIETNVLKKNKNDKIWRFKKKMLSKNKNNFQKRKFLVVKNKVLAKNKKRFQKIKIFVREK
jgi:RecA/RadA recombinase